MMILLTPPHTQMVHKILIFVLHGAPDIYCGQYIMQYPLKPGSAAVDRPTKLDRYSMLLSICPGKTNAKLHIHKRSLICFWSSLAMQTQDKIQSGNITQPTRNAIFSSIECSAFPAASLGLLCRRWGGQGTAVAPNAAIALSVPLFSRSGPASQRKARKKVRPHILGQVVAFAGRTTAMARSCRTESAR